MLEERVNTQVGDTQRIFILSRKAACSIARAPAPSAEPRGELHLCITQAPTRIASWTATPTTKAASSALVCASKGSNPGGNSTCVSTGEAGMVLAKQVPIEGAGDEH